jgi:hypothetical protein
MRVLGKLSRDNDGLKWEKEEREMNIEHDGKTYEVLTLDRISLITHARLAGGKVVEAGKASPGYFKVRASDESDPHHFCYKTQELADNNIQPLRLVPKEPVTFEATFAKCHGARWRPVYDLDEGIALQGCEQKRFRCVEIVEEEQV